MEAISTSGPSAKIICDSISEQGHRLVTMEVKMHRFILAEMNTHRVFSRNSASSRAIPYHKIRNRVVDDPALPVHWGAEQKGMQSGEALTESDLVVAKMDWDTAMHYAVDIADALHNRGLHKSLVNRLLEPFMWHTAIITATEWANFFNQRCHPDAQPEMKAVADAMQICYFSSTPKELAHGQWHLPYIGQQDWNDLETLATIKPEGGVGKLSELQKVTLLKKVSVARCARVSYLTHDGIRSIDKDIELCDIKLYGSGHWSPFEHVATPIKLMTHPDFTTIDIGNFVGWKQYRKEFRDENRTKFLPNLPELTQARMRLEAGLSR